MRAPLSVHGRRELAISQVIPAPTGGWNTRDAIADMKEGEAIIMDNWFPRTSDVVIRKGAADSVTGFADEVFGLHVYKTPGGLSKLFASTDAGIYDATTPGAVGAAAIAITNGKVQSVQNATSAGSYLMCVNGTDTLKLYNGTTWTSITGVSTPAITGLTTSTIKNILLFKQRVFFIPNDSRSLWYLPVDSIAGAATELPLRTYMSKGGFLVGFGSWTVDAGEGADDHLAVATSEGQVLLFKGTDPASTATWGLIGVFDLGVPLGLKCFIPYAGDLIYLSTDGVISLTKSLMAGQVSNRVPFSDKILGAFSAATRNGAALFGWCGAVLRKENTLLINIPDIDGTSVQYAMNTQTGAWSRFVGMPAYCMAIMDEQLFMGYTTKTFEALTGDTDFAGNIQADVALAYNYFGNKGRKKKLQQVRPILTGSDAVNVSIAVATDFNDDTTFGTTPAHLGAAASVWDTGVWDTAVWGGATTVTKSWIHTPSKVGYCHSIKMRISSRVTDLSWSATNALLRAAALAT